MAAVAGATMDYGKVMTIRFSPEQADALELVSAAERQSMSEIIRVALSAYLRARTTDPEFRKSMRHQIHLGQNLLGGRTHA